MLVSNYNLVHYVSQTGANRARVKESLEAIGKYGQTTYNNTRVFSCENHAANSAERN